MKTGYDAKIVAHSKAPGGREIVTYELTYPRWLHPEIMTHRSTARNASSSRATPTKEYLKAVWRHPAGFVFWGLNEKGMQSRKEAPPVLRWIFQQLWYGARFPVLIVAFILWKLGAHKQFVNRILEPWAWITVVLTMTDDALPNFFGLRAHPDAQPEFQKLAYLMFLALKASVPRKLRYGQWHLPYIDINDCVEVGNKLGRDTTAYWDCLKACSVARCCRISIKPFDSDKRSTVKDLDTHGKLLYPPDGNPVTWNPECPRHASPFEHVARPNTSDDIFSGPFRGWVQYRKELDHETIQEMPRRFNLDTLEFPDFVLKHS
jgi:hypothetical protein